MFNDLHRPLLAATLCIPFCAGLALATLFGRVISMIHSKLPMTAQGLLIHLLAIVTLLSLTALIAMRTWHMPLENRFLGLGRSAWRGSVVVAFGVGLLLGFSSSFFG